jgi:hypothetical protein
VLTIGRMSPLECSIIEGNEQNKLSFHKEPSFIYAKGEEGLDDDIRASQNSFAHLLTSKNLF